MAPIELTFLPNYVGDGGEPFITMEGSDRKWYMLCLDSIEEAKVLLSQAHIAYGNICEQDALNTLKESYGIKKSGG